MVKKELAKQRFLEVESKVVSQNFTIEITEVYPFNTAATAKVLNDILLPTTGQTASRIGVENDGYSIVFTDEKVAANMPFFGERRIAAGYGADESGIIFDSKKKNYKASKNLKKKRMEISFDANEGTQSYTLFITIFSNKSVLVNVNSSHLNNISYAGILK